MPSNTLSNMGRNRYTEREIGIIARLLDRKCQVSRFHQKEIRHKLRVDFNFQISDFGEQGKAFTSADLHRCVEMGVIKLLPDGQEPNRHDEGKSRGNGRTGAPAASVQEDTSASEYVPIFGVPPHKRQDIER